MRLNQLTIKIQPNNSNKPDQQHIFTKQLKLRPCIKQTNLHNFAKSENILRTIQNLTLKARPCPISPRLYRFTTYRFTTTPLRFSLNGFDSRTTPLRF